MSMLRLEMDEEDKEEVIDRYLKNFKDNLYRLQGDISAEKFAEKIDMSRDFVTKGKKVDPKLSTLIKISHYLDISLDDLVGLNVKREPLSARLEVKTIMENLFLAYQAANLFVQEGPNTGQLSLVIDDGYIKEFMITAIDAGAAALNDIRTLYTKLYGDKSLYKYNGKIVDERELKKVMMDKYMDYHKQHAHFNDYEDTLFEDDLIERFDREYKAHMEKGVEDVLKWGNEIDMKHRELIEHFYIAPQRWEMPPEWRSIIKE